MKTISILVLVVIYLTSLAYGMDCPTEAHGVPQSIPSCPRPGLDSNDKNFCCTNLQARTVSCCDSFEWMIQETKNAIHVTASAPSLYTTKLQQTGSILFSLYFGHFIIGKLT